MGLLSQPINRNTFCSTPLFYIPMLIHIPALLRSNLVVCICSWLCCVLWIMRATRIYLAVKGGLGALPQPSNSCIIISLWLAVLCWWSVWVDSCLFGDISGYLCQRLGILWLWDIHSSWMFPLCVLQASCGVLRKLLGRRFKSGCQTEKILEVSLAGAD